MVNSDTRSPTKRHKKFNLKGGTKTGKFNTISREIWRNEVFP